MAETRLISARAESETGRIAGGDPEPTFQSLFPTPGASLADLVRSNHIAGVQMVLELPRGRAYHVVVVVDANDRWPMLPLAEAQTEVYRSFRHHPIRFDVTAAASAADVADLVEGMGVRFRRG